MPSQLPAGTNLSSPQIKLINDWNDAFTERNMEVFVSYLHKDFRRSVYPRSLGQSEQNREEALKELRGLLGFVTGIDVGHTPCYSNLLHPGSICSADEDPLHHRSTRESCSPRLYSNPSWSIPAST